MTTLEQNNTIKIGIIGLGYVGLPLAIEFSKKYSVIGLDKDANRIKQLNDGIDKTLEVNKEELNVADIIYTVEVQDISDCNVYIITVPTPVDQYNNPDMLPLNSASKMVGNILNKNDVIIYESTVYPGATEEYCVPILEKASGLKYNKDFFCGYSPERINPGDKEHNLKTIIKITSGSNEKTAIFVDNLYQSIISAGTHKVSSIAVAESAKVIENIQRDVNIALINEFSKIFNKLKINTNEVLEASSTKWNFLPFRPGLVGGHCIGVDPYYLTHRAIEVGYHPEIILAGRRMNNSMGQYIANATILQMAQAKINPVGSNVAILGITFKENCPDMRNTKVPDIISHLKDYGCNIIVTDPYADHSMAKTLYNIDLVDIGSVSDCDVQIIAVSHDEYKYITKETWTHSFNNNGILIDVKAIYPVDFFKDTNIQYWSL